MPTAQLRPCDFVERLSGTGLAVPGYPQPVRIRRYMCANPSFGGNVQAEALRLAVLQVALTDPVASSAIAALREHRALSIMTNGQGHPDTIARFMAIVWAQREALRAVRNARGEEWLRPFFAAPNPLEAMADATLFGLDCIGFVGRYLQAAQVFPHYHAWYPRNYADAFLPVARSDEVESVCVLIWTNGSHVAIVDEVIDCSAGGLVHVTICQSSAGGPQTNKRVWLRPCNSEWLDFGGINRAYREAANRHHDLTQVERADALRQNTQGATGSGYRGGMFFDVSHGSPAMPVRGHVYVGKLPGLRQGWDQSAAKTSA